MPGRKWCMHTCWYSTVNFLGYLSLLCARSCTLTVGFPLMSWNATMTPFPALLFCATYFCPAWETYCSYTLASPAMAGIFVGTCTPSFGEDEQQPIVLFLSHDDSMGCQGNGQPRQSLVTNTTKHWHYLPKLVAHGGLFRLSTCPILTLHLPPNLVIVTIISKVKYVRVFHSVAFRDVSRQSVHRSPIRGD